MFSWDMAVYSVYLDSTRCATDLSVVGLCGPLKLVLFLYLLLMLSARTPRLTAESGRGVASTSGSFSVFSSGDGWYGVSRCYAMRCSRTHAPVFVRLFYPFVRHARSADMSTLVCVRTWAHRPRSLHELTSQTKGTPEATTPPPATVAGSRG